MFSFSAHFTKTKLFLNFMTAKQKYVPSNHPRIFIVKMGKWCIYCCFISFCSLRKSYNYAQELSAVPLRRPTLRHTHICGVMNSKSVFRTLRIDQWTPTTNQIRLFYDMSMWTQLYRTEWAIKSWHATEDTKSLSLDDPWWSIGQIKPE